LVGLVNGQQKKGHKGSDAEGMAAVTFLWVGLCVRLFARAGKLGRLVCMLPACTPLQKKKNRTVGAERFATGGKKV